MITKILLVLAALLAVFLLVAALQPNDFRVERSTTISAPAERAFAQVNDLHLYQVWNPWGKLDPVAQYTHAGPTTGAGASLSWVGNSQIGEGSMTIVETRPPDLILIRLDFKKPMASTCMTEFTFSTAGNETHVRWVITGPKNFISKVVGLVMSMDKMMGDQFELGLASMKAIVESDPAK